jgi:mono/diheme cytochrome c family protein
MKRVASVIASLLLIGTWTIAMGVQAHLEEATPSRGHAFALLVCAACHVVASDQKAPPILRTPGLSFDAIANKPGTTAESLRAFISTTHAKIATSTSMPNPQLADYQMAEVITYILSLRRKQ